MNKRQVYVRDLCKDFRLAGPFMRKKRVLNSLNFTISDGERIGIIGGNGAGKTTLLQIVAGISDPSSGIVQVDGQVTSIFSLGIGLRDDLTGRENIFIDGELQGYSRQETLRFVPDIIAFAELGEFIDRPVRNYSTGMKSRLAFSLLVHIDPEILVIDEALSVGDVRFSAKAQARMHELAARGRIVILVSHSMSAIRTMCTRCIWLDGGRIRMDGEPNEVTQAYVENVSQAREETLKKRVRRAPNAESMRPGFAIKSMQFILDAGEKISGEVLQSKEQVALIAEAEAPPGSGCRAVLEIDRIDGLKICISDSVESLPLLLAGSDGRISFKAEFGSLPLNIGLYQASLTLLHNAVPVARHRRSFEVVNPMPHRGGQAILVTQMAISSSRL